MIGHGGVTAHMVPPVSTDDGVHPCGNAKNLICDPGRPGADVALRAVVLPTGYGEALPAEPPRTRPVDLPRDLIDTGEPVTPE